MTINCLYNMIFNRYNLIEETIEKGFFTNEKKHF